MMEGQRTADAANDNQEQAREPGPGPQPNGPETAGVVKHSPSRAHHAVKTVLGGILPSGKKERIFTMIILAIVLIWAVAWTTSNGYPFWPGLAGVLTIPLLLAALMIDNAYKE